MRKIVFASLLFLIACHNGSCEFGPTETPTHCAEACGARGMKSYRGRISNGCNSDLPAECVCNDVVDAGKP